MRPGPATQAALLVDVSTCLSPHKAAKCALANLASRRMVISQRTLRKTSDSVLLSKEDSLRRPQRPGFPNRAEARFRITPQQFTLENCREPLALPQFQQSKHLTHALGTLCLSTESSAIEKLSLL